MSENSTWTALRNPVFRNMWLASLVSGTCVAAQDTAATWTMNRVSDSPLFLSMMSTVASLPFFFFTLPAGALADMLDRKRMMFVMTIWLAVAAGGLALVGSFNLINPWVLLTAVFLIGTGFAFYSPAWTSIQPEIVSNEELPSASTLGGLQLNISGIIGPAIGGLLLRVVNANVVFAMNAACFLMLCVAIRHLKHPRPHSNLPLESFAESFVTAIRYVIYTPGIQVVLVRNLLFAFFISIIPALIPVVGLKELHLDPSNLGLVFTCMGVGSVLGAVFILPWARAKFHSNTVTLVANVLVAVVFFLMGTVRDPALFLVAAGLAGTAWTMAASELWVAGQRAMPSWARGRMNATIIMAAQGAVALGGIVWGSSVSMWGVKWTLIAACILQLATLLIQLRLSIDFTSSLSFEPAPMAGASHKLIHIPAPHDGPVAVMIDVEIDHTFGKDMLDTLREVRLIHLRNGAFSWRLHEDLGRPNNYRMEMLYPSWTEYLLMQERLTARERETIDKARGFHVGEKPPEFRHFLCVNRELHTQRHTVARPSSMPEAPLSIDKATA
ncbi:MAG: MFS transporter [Verrucomicrobia bacterium]|nr:MFS transporter [Verrucomicrobiota bacterium]MBV8375688.1 MFS transporter [Verrucomicrobiota bacterium]